MTDDRFAIYENPEWLGAAVLWPDSASVDSPSPLRNCCVPDLASLQSTALVRGGGAAG